MEHIKNMPAASIVVIFLILALFALAVIMLFSVCAAYRRQAKYAALGDTVRSGLMRSAMEAFSQAYKTFGQETNTPAILTACIQEHMSVALFCERFLNSAVSLFVTLGLFGTFLGLSMSVSSLTELISFSNTSEWLGVLDSVGGGLMSALSGMGVAFYTSLVGVACSIFLTILRSILSPEAMRGALEAEMELWLDHRLAPKLSTERARDNSDLINRLVAGMNAAAASMERTLSGSTNTLQSTLKGFNGTVESFNQGVRDFSEFDYNLRGTVERLDVAVRDLSNALRKAGQALERSDRG